MTTVSFLESLGNSIARPTDGVIGVVDDLLVRCRTMGLRLEWCDDRCLASVPGKDGAIELPLRKSVLRAILARLAVLCGEQVSPYGGTAELHVEATSAYRVRFVNTTAAQWLEMTVLVPLSAT